MAGPSARAGRTRAVTVPPTKAVARVARSVTRGDTWTGSSALTASGARATTRSGPPAVSAPARPNVPSAAVVPPPSACQSPPRRCCRRTSTPAAAGTTRPETVTRSPAVSRLGRTAASTPRTTTSTLAVPTPPASSVTVAVARYAPGAL